MLIYISTVFLSAFLLFQIQPLISKYILPWFGGTTAVWSTSMLFFQVLLLGGYAYAHLFALQLRPRKQGLLHIVILGGAVLVLLGLALSWGGPLLPSPGLRPPDSRAPIWRILVILLASVGAPYFVLTTTGPLLQNWFRYTHPERSPYRLYALSNLGSLLGLLTYPILVEPYLALPLQAVVWTVGFMVFALLCAITAVQFRRIQAAAEPAFEAGQPLASLPASKLNPWRLLTWLSLAASASVMLLATTNQLSQEIAVIPFLWVLPLSLYLLSFVLTFDSPRWYARPWYLAGLLGATVLMIVVAKQGVTFNILLQIGAYLFLSFFIFMVCHGELYRLKPDPRHLTLFYLMVSLGGAAGGLFVNFAAPWLFKGYWEFPLAILFTWLLLWALWTAERKLTIRGRTWILPPLMGALIIVLAVFLYDFIKTPNTTLEITRNFYGVLRVYERPGETPEDLSIGLAHGVTLHGYQYLDEDRRRLPTSYYGPSSACGLAIAAYADALSTPAHQRGLRVGVIGLGVATLAAYAEAGDYYRFYEINPAVIELAAGRNGYFTYLRDMRGEYDVVEGDARLSLEKELEQNQGGDFDLLFVDAFSSDAVPVHLLTEEAFAVYLEHLNEEGMMAFHVSNNHLDLYSVVQQQARTFGLHALYIKSSRSEFESPAAWILLTHNSQMFQNPELYFHSTEDDVRPIQPWTDQYSNLFSILK